MKHTYIDTIISNGDFDYHYLVDKEIHSGIVSHIVYRKQHDRIIEENRIEYADIGKEYTSPLLRWYNVIFCSASYIPVTDHKYLNNAVQLELKTAATIYVSPYTKEGKNLMNNLPAVCGAVEYGDSMIYIYRKGKLLDFFDFKEIKEIYKAHGCENIDWKIVEKYFALPMENFGYEDRCGFCLQSGGKREQIIITGLVLGYPIESTISFLGFRLSKR